MDLNRQTDGSGADLVSDDRSLAQDLAASAGVIDREDQREPISGVGPAIASEMPGAEALAIALVEERVRAQAGLDTDKVRVRSPLRRSSRLEDVQGISKGDGTMPELSPKAAMNPQAPDLNSNGRVIEDVRAVLRKNLGIIDVPEFVTAFFEQVKVDLAASDRNLEMRTRNRESKEDRSAREIKEAKSGRNLANWEIVYTPSLEMRDRQFVRDLGDYLQNFEAIEGGERCARLGTVENGEFYFDCYLKVADGKPLYVSVRVRGKNGETYFDLDQYKKVKAALSN